MPDRVSSRVLRLRRGALSALVCCLVLFGFAGTAQTGDAGAGPVSPADYLTTDVVDFGRFSDHLRVDDVDRVFATVFHLLDNEVTVRPSENYLFFRFRHAGTDYSGNLRIDAADRDRGIIHFAYFPRNGVDGVPGEPRFKALASRDGVKVTRAGDFTYVVVFDRKAVVFRLNDLRAMKPAERQLRDDERFIGPVFDESGIGFFLVWNTKAKTFLYVLDEERAPEIFASAPSSGQIRIGRRTGFAIYRDRYVERWVLVGVKRREARRNTLFDGPFDQMPDNFLEGDTLRDALIVRRPSLAGRIDRFGNFSGLAGRAIIVPYLHYDDPAELAVFDQCAARAGTAVAYYRCFDRERVG